MSRCVQTASILVLENFFCLEASVNLLCEDFKLLYATYDSSAHHCCLYSHCCHHTQPTEVYNDSLSCRQTQCPHYTCDQDPLLKKD